MTARSLNEKEIVFREGDAADGAYVITRGNIEILKRAKHGEVRLATLEAGGVFGEMALFDQDATRSATARALGKTEVDFVTAQEFREALAQCPPSLLPFLNSLIVRLKDANLRISVRERATVLLDVDLNRLTLMGDGALETIVGPFQLEVANLPYTIGGHHAGSDPAGRNLDIVCHEQPPLVSRDHCQLARQDGHVYLIDQGSRFGTVVNSQVIGRGRASMKAPLVAGDNRVQLGGVDSPYQLVIAGE